MRPKDCTVTFAEIVGADATELDFDPATDYLVIRSIFSAPVEDTKDFAVALEGITEDSPPETTEPLILELLDRTVLEWHLVGADGQPIPQPATIADFDRLPLVVKVRIVPYLARFRGRPDPTPAA